MNVSSGLSAHDFQSDIDIVSRIEGIPLILRICARISGMRFVAVARVTEERWVACSVLDRINFGLAPGGELRVETTICNEIRDSRRTVVIDSVSRDADWCGHPTPAMYGFESYISVPIILSDGSVFGTLCAIDPEAHPISDEETVGVFTLFGDLIAKGIESQLRMERVESDLGSERANAALREQFIAVLGHDLRNPLAAIDAGARLVGRGPVDERGQDLLRMMRNAVGRMAGLVDDLLDFARGRLAGGIPIVATQETDLRQMFGQIVEEMRLAWPERAIEVEFGDLAPLRCDGRRLGQLFSNLLANALTHGARDRPVRVGARMEDGSFTLWVLNGGKPIPEAILAHLFEPFVRGPGQPADAGLGLGLYIAAQIARAHGGELSARSDESETRMTFRMPVPARSHAPA